MNYLNRVLSSCLLLGISSASWAFAPFTVSGVDVQGLQRINRSTVLDYLPIHAGQMLDNNASSKIIQALYKTGFFENVKLGRTGNQLVIIVEERPVVASLNIVGNKAVATDKLKTVLKKLGISLGRTFNSANLEKIKYSLQSQYDELSQYTARVETIVTPLPRNRVAIEIRISEGSTTKVSQISIMGNEAFSDEQLLKNFTLTTPNLLTFFTKDDQYTPEKLDKDLDKLRSFYMDRGYLKFKVDSSQATLTPDKKKIYILVHVTEGPKYTLQSYKLAGDLILPKEKLESLIILKPGAPFSRQAILDSEKRLTAEYGNHGYAFVAVQVIPIIDEANHLVSITFNIAPGRQVYVRRINFIGNTKTEDVVLRQAMQQMEGGLVNMKQINDSVRNLNFLGYVKNVKKDIVPVPDKNDQVDLNIHLQETNSAQISVGGGYSTTEKLFFQTGLTQQNFFGTGKTVGLSFDDSAYTRIYSLTYNDPFYTIDGVSRGFRLFAQQYKPGAINLSTSYTYNVYGGELNYGIPLTNYDRINFGTGLQRIDLLVGSMPPSVITDFVNNNGTRFDELNLSSSWMHVTYDRAIFPTEGLKQTVGGTLSVPLSSKSLHYYKLNYALQFYQPLVPSKALLLFMNGGVGYGNGFGSTHGLPFFANYFGGGIDGDAPVAAFEPNTLGPRDQFTNPLGGNFALYGKAGIILPQFNDDVRTMIFTDAGNIYQTRASMVDIFHTDPGKIDLHQLRYSVGFTLEWRTFVGPLVFSVAQPMSHFSGDRLDPFQFTVGANF